MSAVGVVGLQHGLSIDQDLPGRGLKDGGEGFGAAILSSNPCGPRLFGFGVGALLTTDEAIAALGLTACAQLQLVITQELLGGKEKALGGAGLELELSLAELAGGLVCAHGAIIYGQLDLAALHLDLAGGAPNDCFKHTMQRGSLRCFLDDTLDLLVSNLGEVGFLARDGGLQLDRVRHPVDNVLISFDRLQPAAVLASQPERDAGGMQIMLRRIEVNSSQLLGFRRTH